MTTESSLFVSLLFCNPGCWVAANRLHNVHSVDMRCTVSQCGSACLVSVVWWAAGIRVSGNPGGSSHTGSASAAAWSVLMPLLWETYRKWERHWTVAFAWGIKSVPNVQSKSNYTASPDGKVIKSVCSYLKSQLSLSCVYLPCVTSSIQPCSSSLTRYSFIYHTFKQRWALHVHDSSPDWWNCHSSLPRE